MAKLHFGLGLLATGLIVWACSTGDGGGVVEGTGSTSSTGSTPATLGGGGSPIIGNGGNTSSYITGPDGGIVVRREQICDAAGNCTCTKLASIGAAASAAYGAVDGSVSGTDAFQNWLQTKSNLQAVDFYPTDTVTLTAEWLAGYDVIILQDLRTFAFTADEITAFQEWINGGGGVIALSGYFSDNATEITPTNSLISSTGVQLLAEEQPPNGCDAAAESTAVCPSPNTAGRCYCWGVATPLIQWDTTHAIAANIKSVGSFRGRRVDPGTDGTTVIKYKDMPVGVAKTVGAGKVFVFGDEWVTYNSQWGAYPTSTASMTDINSGCVDQNTNSACTAAYVFQTMQFWYNTILWVQPPSLCTFVIDEPDTVILT